MLHQVRRPGCARRDRHPTQGPRGGGGRGAGPPFAPWWGAGLGRGVDLSDLRARQFVARDFERFDLIVGMDAENIANIEVLRPDGSDTEVRLFTDYAPESGMSEVPDPYYTRDFDGALDLIEDCARGLKAALEAG